MKTQLHYLGNIPKWVIRIWTLLIVSVSPGLAQQGSTGNTYIFGGAEMTFFGNHDFANGGSGALPGIIGTVRSGPFGILNFYTAASHNGGSDGAHVDGYVRKYGTTPFVFPVGDNGFYGPFAASGDGTMGAYYHGDATVAVTSNLAGGDYPILPLGGPFPTSAFDTELEQVSIIEYWDIDGANATPLTLTWDAGSDISGLTNAQLSKLTITGWNGSEWVAIPSVVDPTSVLSGTSDITAGSITTITPIIPNTYTAYTLASRVTPLPVTLISFTVQAESGSALLHWATTEETNSAHFQIERSQKGKQWAGIGIVKSSGESHTLMEYSFIDKTPLSGENLYRLKIVDLDGTFAYSRIRSIQLDGNTTDLSIYPNPASDKFNIRDYAKVKEMVISDLSGRSVYRSESFTAGHGVVDIRNLAQGMYILRITHIDGSVYTHKLVHVK